MSENIWLELMVEKYLVGSLSCEVGHFRMTSWWYF